MRMAPPPCLFALSVGCAGRTETWRTRLSGCLLPGFDFVPHLVLVIPNHVGVSADELFLAHSIDRRWSLYSLLLSANKNGHKLSAAAPLIRLLFCRQLTLGSSHPRLGLRAVLHLCQRPHRFADSGSRTPRLRRRGAPVEWLTRARRLQPVVRPSSSGLSLNQLAFG